MPECRPSNSTRRACVGATCWSSEFPLSAHAPSRAAATSNSLHILFMMSEKSTPNETTSRAGRRGGTTCNWGVWVMHVCFATPPPLVAGLPVGNYPVGAPAPGHSTLLCELLLYHRKTIPGPWRPPPQLSSRCPWRTVEPRGSSACASSAPWHTAGPRLPLRRRPHAPPALRLLSVRSAIDEAYLMRETIIGHQSRSEALRGL